jgi:hypothetical protein
MPDLYEAWQDPADSSITFTLASSIPELRQKGLLSVDARLLYRFEARSYNDAMAMHHERMGWEPYRPLNLDPGM